MISLFFSIGIFALSISSILSVVSLRNLEKRICKLERDLAETSDDLAETSNDLNSVHRNLSSYPYRFTSSSEEYVDYQVCQHWRTMPKYEIDLREFLPGDKIVFKPTDFGFSCFEIVRSCNPFSTTKSEEK